MVRERATSPTSIAQHAENTAMYSVRMLAANCDSFLTSCGRRRARTQRRKQKESDVRAYPVGRAQERHGGGVGSASKDEWKCTTDWQCTRSIIQQQNTRHAQHGRGRGGEALTSKFSRAPWLKYGEPIPLRSIVQYSSDASSGAPGTYKWAYMACRPQSVFFPHSLLSRKSRPRRTRLHRLLGAGADARPQ